MKNALKSSLALVILASTTFAHAGVPATEIDANVGIGAFNLIAGAITVLRSRKSENGQPDSLEVLYSNSCTLGKLSHAAQLVHFQEPPPMKNLLKSSLALALVLLGTTAAAHAALPTPEIDANVGIGALTLIAGATAVLRSRKR